MMFDHPQFLKRVLLADAATCIAAGLVMTVLHGPVEMMTGIPMAVLMTAGLLLFPSALVMAVAALRTPHPQPLVIFIILANIGWVLASLLLVFTGFVAPNALGLALILAQAAAVAVLAGLELKASLLLSRPLVKL